MKYATYYNVDEPRKCYDKWKKSIIKGHMLHNSIYMQYQVGISIETADLWLPEAGEEGLGSECLMDMGVSFGVINNVFEIDRDDGCTTLWMF